MVCDPALGQETLEKMAVNKLSYVMERDRERKRKKETDLF